MEQVKFLGLNTSIIVGPNKRSNLETILRLSTNSPQLAVASDKSSPTTPPAKKPALNLALTELLFVKGSLHYSDQSLTPNCNFSVQEFGGSIKNLSSEQNTAAEIYINGKVDAHAPFTVSGKVNPLVEDLFVDLGVSFKNTDLSALTPYMEKFAGYVLQKGRLSFDVYYTVMKNALKGTNGIRVDQFTLGAKSNSPDATKLPVKLAVALLKDRNGLIALDVPVEGRIDDPKFKLSGVIFHVVLNVITKAATSPFSLLSALFGGGEELSFVDFQSGRTDMTETESKKLDTLSKALYQRPALNLEINGSVDPAQDRPALARIKLDQQIKSLWIKQLVDSGKPAVAINDLKLEPKDYERMVKKAYKQTFGRYHATEFTNIIVAANGTNSGTLAPVSRPANLTQNNLSERGATLCSNPPPPPNQPSKSLAKPIKSQSSVQQLPAEPLTELADMEAQLLRKVQVTDEDLLTLMQDRAKAVEAYLLNEKVTAERLFIIAAPKLSDPAFKASNRVNLSLN